ncbi:MAG: MFS transporter [Promethearchaeota archaeon]
MSEIINFSEPLETRHSRWTFLSNAFGLLCSTLIGAVQGFTMFYYETVVGLNANLVAIAMTIFLVYNGVNDPLFGFLIDRNFRFTKKWGRRFPWIVISIVPWTIAVYLLFSVPSTIDGSTNPGAAFAWLLFTLILLDTFGTPLDIVAIVLGMLLPPLFTDMIPGDPRTSYSMMGAIIALIALFFGILSLPGNREDKIMIDKYYSPDSVKRMNFFKVLKEAVKSRSFVVWFVFGIFNGTYVALVVENLIYVTTFVLQVGGDMFFVILGLNLIGNLIAIPLWLRILRKINDNKKALVIAGFISSAALFPMSFFQGLIDIMIMAFILGLAQGGVNSYVYTIVGPSVIEDVIVKMKKNQKAVLIGILSLLIRIVSSIDEFTIAFVHNTTGFIAGNNSYADLLAAVTSAGGDINLVLLGIRLLQGVIPGLYLLAGVLIIWKFFPLTQERVLSNKAKLQELGF